MVVNDVSLFQKNDFVLIIQIKGATIDLTNSPKFGSIVDYNECGNYEFATIKDVSNGMIDLVNPLCRNYNIQGNVQLIKVPVYDDAIVTERLTSKAWDGSTGGVLAIKVNNVLTLNSNIDVNSLGFRGGILNNSKWECDQLGYFYPFPSWQGAKKGEGITDVSDDKKAGRGALANGGGGGNCTNAGGAGGGNNGLGGHGGKQFFFECDSIEIGGMPGNELIYNNDINKIFLGGAGGAGHQNDNAGTKGENGGGIIIIIADKIEGNNFKISSNGAMSSNSQNDAAGGGGAGGCILLDVNHLGSTPTTLEVNGGDGGDCNVGPYVHCYGTGGGGGGGTIWIKGNYVPNNLNYSLNGGVNGIITNRNTPCYLSNYGASSGSAGQLLLNLNMNQCCDESSFSFPNFNSISNLILVKDCLKTDSTITLTSANYWKSGALWYANKIPVQKGFKTEFSFRFSEGVNKYTPEEFSGADGIAFVIQNHSKTAIGSPGGGLGYKSIPNSFAIEFDTYKNADDNSENFKDPNENHVGIFCNGKNPNLTTHGDISNLFTYESIMPLIPDGRIFYAKIDFENNNYLKVYLDSNNNLNSPAIISISGLDLSKLLQLDLDEFAWIGFTSATGNSYERHELLSWSICPKPTNTILDVKDDNLDHSDDYLNIYPNPTSEEINVLYDVIQSGESNFEIYDLLGNQILSIENGLQSQGRYSKVISLDNLTSGIYNLIYRNNNFIKSNKIVVIK